MTKASDSQLGYLAILSNLITPRNGMITAVLTSYYLKAVVTLAIQNTPITIMGHDNKTRGYPNFHLFRSPCAKCRCRSMFGVSPSEVTAPFR